MPGASVKSLRGNILDPKSGFGWSSEAFCTGAACVKLQFDCLSAGVKIELDHGPINAPLMSALGQKQTFAPQNVMSALGLAAITARLCPTITATRRSIKSAANVGSRSG